MREGQGWMSKSSAGGGRLLRVFTQRRVATSWPFGRVCFEMAKTEFQLTPNEVRRLINYLENAIIHAEAER